MPASQRALVSSRGLTYESFSPAEHYDFTRAPHPGMLAYERARVATSARTFCRLAAHAARALGLAPPRRLRSSAARAVGGEQDGEQGAAHVNTCGPPP